MNSCEETPDHDFRGRLVVLLRDVATLQTSLAKGKRTLGHTISVPYLRVANVQDGYLDLSGMKQIEISERDLNRYALAPGDVLFTEGGDFDKLGRGTVWRGEITPCLHQNHVFAVRVQRTEVLPEFLAYLAASPVGRGYFIRCSKQSTNLASINSRQLMSLPGPIPPLLEQHRIADVLEAWDRATATVTRLIQLKRELSDRISRRLIRWEEPSRVPLHRLISPVVRIVPCPTEPYKALSIRSHGKGTFQRIVNNPQAVRMDQLFRVEAGDLIVNITFAWEGAIAIVPTSDGGSLVSHRFPTFTVDEQAINPKFLWRLIKTRRFIYLLGTVSPGGAGRIRVLNKKEFLALEVPLPPRAQQDDIAAVLDWAETELECLSAYSSKLLSQKLGLMQSLLTGKIRLQPDGQIRPRSL